MAQSNFFDKLDKSSDSRQATKNCISRAIFFPRHSLADSNATTCTLKPESPLWPDTKQTQGIKEFMLHMIKEQNSLHGKTDLAFECQHYDPIKMCL